MIDNETYHLIGYYNTSCNSPDFVFPVFVKNNALCLYAIEKVNPDFSILSFTKLNIPKHHIINPLNEFAWVANDKYNYHVGDKFIVGFQSFDNYVYLDEITGMKDHIICLIKDYPRVYVDDEILYSQLSNFIDEVSELIEHNKILEKKAN